MESKQNIDLKNILIVYGISPTPVRLLVLNCLAKCSNPVSMSEIEEFLETVDKSSISRTLTLFKEKKLVHFFDDTSGSVKFELCHCKDHDFHDDSHLHFHCHKCGKTICMNSIKIPEISLPEGYKIEKSNFIVSGICPDCAKIQI